MKLDLNRRQALKSFAQGATALATCGLSKQLFATPAALPEKHGTLTGYCIESLEQGLTLGHRALTSGQVSDSEVVQARKNLIPQTRTALRALFQQDYGELNIIQVDAWILSRNEARFYAALAQT